jgi:hypothetical protein
MEALDPEPLVPPPRRRRAEVLVGLVVVLGVLGVAGWDWGQQERQASAYAAGQRAAQAYRWEEAQAAFAGAGDYQDAGQRAQAAAATIRERDEQYAAARRDDPLAALSALQTVARLQPGYRDSAARLAASQDRVLRGALAGAVVLRPTAQPPGLYVYNAAGWQWLPDSDAASRVLASAAPGYVLYDSPVPDAPAPGPRRRHLFRATLTGGRPLVDRFALDPGEFVDYRVGPEGLWAIRGLPTGADLVGRVQGFTMFNLAYQVVSSPRGRTFTLPNPRWLVLDMAADGRHYLLADLTLAGSATPTSTLYLGDAYGGKPHPLMTVPGLVLQARFSPDERAMLLVTARPGAQPGEELHTVLLLDPARSAAPWVVEEQMVSANDLAENSRPVAATFLSRGPRAGQVLLLTTRGQAAWLSLYNPADPRRPPQPLWAGEGANLTVAVRESATTAGLILCWQQGRDQALSAALIYVDAQDQAMPLVPETPRGRFSTGWLHAGQLVYLSLSQAPDVTGGSLFVSSLPLDALHPDPDPSATGVPPGAIRLRSATLLYQVPTRNANAVAAGPLHLGPDFLATVAADGLHAHPYNTMRDVLLEPGVTAIYPIDPATAPQAGHILP